MFETEEENRTFRELYEKYKNFMYKIAFDIIKDEHEAEDIVHTSFIKLGGLLNKIDMSSVKRTRVFIGTIARNTAIDYYRKKKKIYEEVELSEEISGPEDIEKDLIDKYNYQILVAEIGILPDKYKDVLRLHYIYELSIQETADALSISENNTYARLSRAKKMLLKVLEEEKVNEA